MNVALGSALAFAALAIVVAVLERVFPARARRTGLRGDLPYWLMTPIVSHSLTAAGVALAMLARTEVASGIPIAAQVALILLGGDLIGYWAHRALHTRRLWRIHAVHHSAPHVDWLASVRLHPFDDVVQRLAQLVPFAVAGFDLTLLALYVGLIGLVALVQHANVPWSFGPLRYVVVSPAFHAWHHSHQPMDKNFAAMFPIWDVVFGTFYMPAAAADAIGIREPMPEGIVAQTLWPFRR